MRLCAIVFIAAFVLSSGAALSKVPPYITYQGVLTNADGQAMPDGTYDLTFRLYDVSTEGTPFWEDTRQVTVTRGIFNTYLGPFEFEFDRIYWLGISVDIQPDLEPRTPLVSVPFSLTAQTVQDSAITTMKLAPGSVIGDRIAEGQVVRALNGIQEEVLLLAGENVVIDQMENTITISASGGGGGVSGSGQAGQVAFWNGTSSITGDDWLYWDSVNRRLGVGTDNPNARLRVVSDEYLNGVFASTHQSDTTEVLRANYLGGGSVEATAIRGISRPADGFGIGGNFTGGQYGLKTAGNGGDTGRYIYGIESNASGNTMNMSYRYGIWATAHGPSAGNNLGVVGYAYGEGNASVGVYGWGSGDNKDVWGVYGDVDGYGLGGGRYAIYGETFGAGDSVYAGYFDGNLVYTGGFYKPSDVKFKTNLQPVDGALEKILALEPRKYTYDRSRYTGISLPRGEHYGLIAQEVEEIIPELIGDLYHPAKPALRGDEPEEGESFGYKGINYIELIPILVQAIKEQQQTIEELKTEVQALKNR